MAKTEEDPVLLTVHLKVVSNFGKPKLKVFGRLD